MLWPISTTVRPDRGFALDIMSPRAQSGPPASSRHAGWKPALHLTLLCATVAERVLAQEIEIAAAVGLQYLAAVEPGIAALGRRCRRRLAVRQLLRRDQQVD